MRNILVSLAVFLVCGAAFYLFFIKPHQVGTLGSSQNNATSTPQIVTPDYKKPIAFSASTPTEIRAQLNEQLSKIQAQIEVSPLNLNAWVNLGALHKIGGDYSFAIEAWEFVGGAYSSNSTPFYNLGDLYQNFLKNYPKAEENYLKAIEAMPKSVGAYANLFNLYHYQYKMGTGADAAILEKGLKYNPNDPTLLDLKTQLQ